MCLVQGHLSIQADVDFGCKVIADLPRAQVVRVAYARDAADDFEHFVFGFGGEGFVRELSEAGPQQLPGYFDQHGAHDDGCQRIQDRPAVPQQDSASDTDGCADGREGIRTMVPCVRLQRLGVQVLSLEVGVLVQQLLDGDGDEGGPEGEDAGLFEVSFRIS